MEVSERLAWVQRRPMTPPSCTDTDSLRKNGLARRRLLASCKTLAITVHLATAALRDLRELVVRCDAYLNSLDQQ